MPFSSRRANFYELLGVPADATQEQIRSAFRAKVHITHPDSKGKRADLSRFATLKQAYDVLSDPEERRRYDRTLGLGPQAARRPFHRRSYSRLFETLFSKLHVAFQGALHQLEEEEPPRRRAG
jgi:DnaJ-class molecular chaperone